MKGMIIFFLIVSVLFIFIVGAIQYMRVSYGYTRANVLLMILREPDVLDAEILFNRNDFVMPNCRFGIRILFNDGCSIDVEEVNEYGKGNIILNHINGFSLLLYNITDRGAEQRNRTNIILYKADIQLESIHDIIRNHQDS
jgi:hypothetical protein